MPASDIKTKDDVSFLIGEFYQKVRKDELLGPIFKDVDWHHHTPVIIDFWSMILLGDPAYKGNPFVKHVPLPIQRHHFDRWLEIFSETVNEHFVGEKAAEAIDRANSIASIFQFKLGLTGK